MRLWFFTCIQTRTPFLWGPDGVYIFSERKTNPLPDNIHPGDRAPPAKRLTCIAWLLTKPVAPELQDLVRIHIDRNMDALRKCQFVDDRTDDAAETANRFCPKENLIPVKTLRSFNRRRHDRMQ